MARLTDFPFDLNDYTKELTTGSTGAPGTITTPVHSGTIALEIANTGAAEAVWMQFHAPNTQDVIYWRAYIRAKATPTGTITLCGLRNGAAAAYKVAIRLTASLTLQLYNVEDSAQVGSDSSAISTNTWYRVEGKCDTTTLASTLVEAMAFTDTPGASNFWNPSGTINLAAAPDTFMVGMIASDATADMVFDDCAVNNDAGSIQNSWCGEAKGEIIMSPNAAGDNSGFSRGGTDSGANWSQVEELPPNDVTDYVFSNTLDVTDDYNLAPAPAGIASNDIITVVMVGVRFAVSAATGADPSIVLRIKATASGTVEESANILVDVTAWNTHDTSGTRPYKLVLYDLPGASTTAWTKADLDTTQIGVRVSVGDTHDARVTALWLVVDYKAASGTTYEDSVSLGRTLAATIANNVTWGPSISLGRTMAVTQGNAVDFQDAVTLGRVLAVAMDNVAVLENAISLARTMAVTTIGGLAFEDNITLGIALAVAIAELVTKEESITLASVRGVLAAAQMDVYPSISLARVLALSSSELVTFEVSITLASGRAVAVSSIVTFEEAVVMAASFGLSILDQLAGQVILTPVVRLSLIIRSKELILVADTRHQLGLSERSRQLTLPER